MRCPKCGRETPDTASFCIRCHATLRFVCPACRHPQDHGRTCDACGADFEKYLEVLETRMVEQAEAERRRTRARASLLRQVLLLPLTGGLSLLKYFHDRLQGK
jgi:hypothetical protein